MERVGKTFSISLFMVALVLIIGSCGPQYDASGQQIITGKDALSIIASDGVVLVDARNIPEYMEGHVTGAVCISRDDIMVNSPYPNLVADRGQIGFALGMRGISTESRVVIYDGNQNMDAARLWWTMVAYGHDPEKVQVVSGGFEALKDAGVTVDAEFVNPEVVEYAAKEIDASILATKAEVQAQVDNPDPETVIVDTRTDEEFKAGTIPGSIHVNFTRNNVVEGTYRPIKQIRLIYMDKEIVPSKTVILFCKTSVRGAQTYLALYNAGYRNLKLYDGAWVEWSGSTDAPTQAPQTTDLPVLNAQDGS